MQKCVSVLLGNGSAWTVNGPNGAYSLNTTICTQG